MQGCAAMRLSLKEPTVSFEDIRRLDCVILELHRIALFIKASIERPELVLGVKSSKVSILLYGSAGVEKTLLAYATARACGAKVISVRCLDLVSGRPAHPSLNRNNQVREIFSTAVRNTPCAILLEAIEVLSPDIGFKADLSGSFTGARLQLLKEINEPREGIIIMATTNRVASVDGCILRKFLHRIEVKVPKEDVITAKFTKRLKFE